MASQLLIVCSFTAIGGFGGRGGGGCGQNVTNPDTDQVQSGLV